jgi:glycosyltransferase involved in cell wall biosynthesis
MRKCAANRIPYQIKIIHTTPNLFGRFYQPGKYHIGRVFWETDKLPPSFAAGAQMMDEIWTGSLFNKLAIQKAGVTKPIYIIPEAIETQTPDFEPFKTVNASNFKFYSIFEWTERKNPTALIEAYWREFEHDQNVSLTLKTYIDNFTPEKRNAIREKFTQIKTRLNLSRYAPIYLFTDLLNRDEIYRFHNSFDCYVSPHRGEGWGIPQMEAMLSGKAIISTNLGGVHEYIQGVAMLIPAKMVPVANVDRNQIWYLPDQNWGEVDIDKFREAMRFMHDHPKTCKDMGKLARQLVIKKFSLEVVGKQMRDRLEIITNQLTN